LGKFVARKKIFQKYLDLILKIEKILAEKNWEN